MKGLRIKVLKVEKGSEEFKTLSKHHKRSIHELNYELNKRFSELDPVERMKHEFVICEYPTIENPNEFEIEDLQNLEEQGRVINISGIGNPEDRDLKQIVDCWEELNDGQLREKETRFYIEEHLNEEFYIEDVETGFLTTLFHEINIMNIEGVLVDEIEVLGSRTHKKYIIGIKQRENNWQDFYFSRLPKQVKSKTISR